MRIKEIKLTNFKRFSNTRIIDIPKTARLVMLVGSNGSGKSSLIEAAYFWYRSHWQGGTPWDINYHLKQAPGTTGNWNDVVELVFHDPQPATDDARRSAVYARSAYRNEPDFQLTRLEQVDHILNERRIGKLIENDQTVSSNYRRLVSDGFEEVYEGAQVTTTIGEFREKAIGPIRDSMEKLFPGLVLNSLGNPLTKGTFRFDKGISNAFLYKNLSGGEKAAFDILLDLFVKRNAFSNTVFFIDEPEAHLASALQGAFLELLLNSISENSQLWLATHSIGMMRKARELAHANPQSVVFFDFDGQNFDLPAVLRPIEPDRPFWKRAMQIALDDLAGYIAPEHIVLCEGGQLRGGSDFDAACYNTIFQSEFPQSLFLGAGSADDIQNDPRGVRELLGALAPEAKLTRIIDRDDRTDAEIKRLKNGGVRVLSLRTIESYLLDDSVLQTLCAELGQPTQAPILLSAKADALRNSVANGGAADDLKRPAGDIYNAAKRLFPNRKLGSDKREFMKGICAPLIKSGTPLYAALKGEIFG